MGKSMQGPSETYYDTSPEKNLLPYISPNLTKASFTFGLKQTKMDLDHRLALCGINEHHCCQITKSETGKNKLRK